MSLSMELLRQRATITVYTQYESACWADELHFECEEDRKDFARKAKTNWWRWCVAVVAVEYVNHRGSASLGMCSYEDEEDFRASEYFEDMKQEALEDLHRNICKDLYILTIKEREE